jgi:hypothetical protein
MGHEDHWEARQVTAIASLIPLLELLYPLV